MKKKTYILDTNVLLTDPDSLFSFKDNEIILPFTIIEELDKIKGRPNEVGANAREIARKLSELISSTEPGSLKKGIRINNDGLLRVVAISDFSHERLQNEWDPTNKDNHILEVCRGLYQEALTEKKEPPVLVTRDIVLRVKCDFLGIPCEDYKKSSVAENPDRLYVGHESIEVPDEVIQDFWETNGTDGENTFNCVIDDYCKKPPSPNQFITLQSSFGEQKDFQVVRYLDKGEPLKIVRELKKPIFNVTPRNKEQNLALDLLLDPAIKMITLIGRAGSGKTLISIAAGLNQVLEKKKYKSLVVCRPIVPVGNDIGYLPGDKMEKLEPWIAPIKDNLRFLLFSGRKSKNAEQTLQGYFDDGVIEVEAITYLRGRSIADAFIIIDEAQNLTAHELKTIITRVGENTKIVLTGDIEQIDNIYIDSVSNGLTVAVEKFKEYPIAGHVTLVKGERSELASLASRIL